MSQNRINEYRERLKMVVTQYDLARALGCSQARVSLIETGRITPTEEEKVKIAAVLRVGVEQLWPEEAEV